MNVTNWRNTKTDFANDTRANRLYEDVGGSLMPVDLSQNFNMHAGGVLLEGDVLSTHVRCLMKKG